MSIKNNELFNNFSFTSKSQAKRLIDDVISKHLGLAEKTQKVLFKIASDVALHNNVERLNQLVKGLSENRLDGEGKLILSATAKSIGIYMQDALPIKWDLEHDTYCMERKAKKEGEVIGKLVDWDYETTFKMLKEVRYDRYHKNSSKSSELSEDEQFEKFLKYAIKKVESFKKGDGLSLKHFRELNAIRKAVGMDKLIIAEEKTKVVKEKEGVVVTGKGFLKDVVNG